MTAPRPEEVLIRSGGIATLRAVKEEEKTVVAPDDAPVREPAAKIAEDLVVAFGRVGFELIEPLGSGGMAEVFLALETELGRRVAIKVMRDELTGNEELRTRFVEEAQRVARLEHSNILTLFRVGTIDNLRFIVMQLATEGDLAQRIKGRTVGPAEAAGIAARLGSALAYAHDQGIVHRDIKPGNVFFNKDGEPILADFGIAKSLVDPSRTQVGSIIGTPRYMSPEQAAGEEVDDKTDVYALGLVFFEMMAHRLPQGRGDLKELRNALPVKGRGHAELIFRCLSNDPAARPTAAEFVAALSDSRPLERWSIVLAGALAVVAGAVLFAAIYFGSDANAPAALVLDIEPGDARVFLNGQEVSGPMLRMTGDTGEVALVKRGHVGELRQIDSDLEVLSAALAPLTLPDVAEKQRFHARFDDESLGPDQLVSDDLSNPVYRQLIQLKRASLSGASIATEAERLRKLASLGDDAAALKLFLAASVSPPLVADDRDVARSWVANASNSDSEYPGYGLASYYRALGIIQERGVDQFTARDRAMVRDLLARSFFQGLNWPDDNMAWYLTMACNVPLAPSEEASPSAATAACVAAMPSALASCLAPGSGVSSPEALLSCLRSAGLTI
ncbi:MAG: serine/threonine-protein kinase [Pseudomonadota bacterium]